MKVIFLDVYGVLIHSKYQNPENLHIDEEKVEFLKQIIDKTNAKIVLSSTWKNSYKKDTTPNKNRYEVLENILNKYELKIHDRLPGIIPVPLTKEEKKSKKYKKTNSVYNPYTRRSGEVYSYLKNNEIESFLIIDDRDFDWKFFKYHKNLIKTSYKGGGLLEKHIKKGVKILNQSKKVKK